MNKLSELNSILNCNMKKEKSLDLIMRIKNFSNDLNVNKTNYKIEVDNIDMILKSCKEIEPLLDYKNKTIPLDANFLNLPIGKIFNEENEVNRKHIFDHVVFIINGANNLKTNNTKNKLNVNDITNMTSLMSSLLKDGNFKNSPELNSLAEMTNDKNFNIGNIFQLLNCPELQELQEKIKPRGGKIENVEEYVDYIITLPAFRNFIIKVFNVMFK